MMTTAERKEQLLRELNRLTGLSLKLDETVKPDKSGKPAEQAKTEPSPNGTSPNGTWGRFLASI